MDLFKKNFLVFSIFVFVLSHSFLKAEEEEILIQAVADQIQVLTKDLKTLEKAVYKKSDIISSTSSSTMKSDGLNEDILTKHLLKLNEIEDQFRELTDKFEEVNFKLDKLSSRVTKIQSDNQLRFSDLENSDNGIKKTKTKAKKVYQDLVSQQTLEQIQDIQFLIYRKNNKLVLLKALKL